MGMKKRLFAFATAGLAAASLAALEFSFPVCTQAQAVSPEAALALEREGNLAGAEGVWKEWLRNHGKDAGAFASLGVVLSKQEKYEAAAFRSERYQCRSRPRCNRPLLA